jgi:hypothetical protein
MVVISQVAGVGEPTNVKRSSKLSKIRKGMPEILFKLHLGVHCLMMRFEVICSGALPIQNLMDL